MSTPRQYNKIRTRAMQLYAIKVRSFVALVLVVAVLLSGYVALIGLSVKNVVVRKEAEAKTALLRAEVSEMEHEYIVRVGGISESRAEAVGLAHVTTKAFAERRVLVGQAY